MKEEEREVQKNKQLRRRKGGENRREYYEK